MSHRTKLGRIAEFLQAKLRGDAECEISSVASLETATAGQLAFIDSKKNQESLKKTRASAVLLPEALATLCPTNYLVVTNPKLALTKLLTLLNPVIAKPCGIHSTAVIAPSCKLADSVTVGPRVVIEDNVSIGANVIIGPGVFIGAGASIGRGSVIHANVSLYHGVTLGAEVIVHSGAVIGADGFGFEQDASGKWVKLPQIGSVVIGNAVEIGANTTIDRGTLDNTTIADGVKLDNLIMVAHNVSIGENTVIAGCTGIAGSAKIGRNCIIAGACAINGHIEIADNVVVSGMSMVVKSLMEPGVYSSGTGILPRKDWQKSAIRFKQLDDIYKRLKKLEQTYDN